MSVLSQNRLPLSQGGCYTLAVVKVSLSVIICNVLLDPEDSD
uniref:Uncharacterized protein n=1 Tax=Anguilla anguilla TaxID=7936 RepID=A0A0E9T7G7_ANGAN